MSRKLHRLNAKQVENHKQPGYLCDGGGLYLQVSRAGTKSWIFRYTLNSRAREMGLGSLISVGLAEARRKAGDCRKLLSDGHDPIEQRERDQALIRDAKAKSTTFEPVAREYIAQRKAGWKSAKHSAQWINTLETYAFPLIGSKPVSAVSTDDVLRILTPIWYSKPETATRVRQRLEVIFDYARVKGHATGENPARWRGHLDHALPKRSKINSVEHHSALPYSEIAPFMAQLRELDTIAASALEFVILTTARTGEARGALPDEFDIEAGVWTIPAARMKAKKEHRIPLSPRALEIVKKALKMRDDKAGPYLFQGARKGRPLSENALLVVLQKTLGRPDLTVHGFRSCFRDWAGEATNFPREVAEAALAHTIKDKSEAAYARGDLFEKRRKLMASWANNCQSIKHDTKVVPIKRRKA